MWRMNSNIRLLLLDVLCRSHALQLTESAKERRFLEAALFTDGCYRQFLMEFLRNEVLEFCQSELVDVIIIRHIEIEGENLAQLTW